MASLSSLSTELKLLIVEYLNATLSHPKEDTPLDEFELWKAQDRNSPWSQRQPPLTHRDILNVSRVNRDFRTIALPFLFKTVTLHNTEASARSLQALAASPYARFVQRLDYTAVVDFPEHRTYITPEFQQKYAPRPEDFPPEVEDALSHLSRFTNLDTIIVEFPWDEDQYVDGFYSRMRHERVADLPKAESQINWRALLVKSYTALAGNDSGVVKKLAMKNEVAQKLSVWWSDEWRKLFGGLEAFECGLRGGDDGRGVLLNMLDGYAASVQYLQMLFCHHLDSVQDFHLFATKEGPVGIDLARIVPFSLPLNSMPRLQRLTLSYFFLSDDLIQFLTSHSRTLRSIRLYNVYVIDLEDGTTVNHPPFNLEIASWKQFFETLPAFPELREFDLAWGFNYGTMGTEHIEDERTLSPFRLPYASVDADDGALILSDLVSVSEGAQSDMNAELDPDLVAYRNFLEVLGITESVWSKSRRT